MSWDPFEEIRKIKREIDRMISDFLRREAILKPFTALKPKGMREPLIDVYETNGEVVVLAELPGIRKEDIIVNASENSVEIVAEAKREAEEKEVGYFVKEREYRGYRRLINLPVRVDYKGAKASYRNGVLEIRLPKAERKEKARIEIE